MSRKNANFLYGWERRNFPNTVLKISKNYVQNAVENTQNLRKCRGKNAIDREKKREFRQMIVNKRDFSPRILKKKHKFRLRIANFIQESHQKREFFQTTVENVQISLKNMEKRVNFIKES